MTNKIAVAIIMTLTFGLILVVAAQEPTPVPGSIVSRVTSWDDSLRVRRCMPVDVMITTQLNAQRIHVKCSVPDEIGILYYAYRLFGDPAFYSDVVAAAHLQLSSTALTLGMDLMIVYKVNPVSDPYGCLPVNCREIITLQMGADAEQLLEDVLHPS
jgi:hypothetical protein